MPRIAREQCESGIYHVVLRGINRQDIFYDDDDFKHFLITLFHKQADDSFRVYGYCLMNNHIHLMLRENDDNVSRIMSRVGTSYAWWYNQKYDRCGHVFQGRFGSECVETDASLLSVIRYIHNNPVKAGLAAAAEDYPWSSIHAYYGGREYLPGLTEPSFILGMIHQNRSDAVKEFKEFMLQANDDQCLDDQFKPRKSDVEVKEEITALMNGEPISRLLQLDKAVRKEILQQIKQSDGVSQRQIARVTGISPNIIFKA